ncbi:MAG: hypothetical protein AAGD14_03385 [Planctomycetota bacterium]
MRRTLAPTALAIWALAATVWAEPIEAKRGTLRVTVPLSGRFVPADPAELTLGFEQYRGPLEVEFAAEHGTWVNEGDVILRFKRKAYEEELARRILAMERTEMAHRHYLARAGMKATQTAEKLARAKRDADRSIKRLKGFREYEKAFRDESERLSEQSRKHRMEDQKDELDQLLKMYSEDELVDATEEIVLKRQKRRYAQSVANNELGDRRRRYQKEWYQHWTEEDRVADAEAKTAAFQRAVQSAEMETEAAKADLVQREFDLGKKREAFEKFRAEGEMLIVRAPAAGVLMHRGGPWKKGAVLKNRMTPAHVCPKGALHFEGFVKESDILRVKAGLACAINPTANAEQELIGRLSLAFLPTPKMGFKATVRFEDLPLSLRPGMTAKGAIVIEELRDVIFVPVAAVRDGKVTVGETEREVVTGPTDGTHIVIRSGLEEGEKVSIP